MYTILREKTSGGKPVLLIQFIKAGSYQYASASETLRHSTTPLTDSCSMAEYSPSVCSLQS